MSEQEIHPGLRKRWSELRDDLVFLPKLETLSVAQVTCDLEAVEFVQVAPADEELMLPEAPHVSADDVKEYAGWSNAVEDQQRMWALAGTAIEGNKVTRDCPDCHRTKEVKCIRCHGWGQENCIWCHGSGHRSCSSCGGSGGQSVTKTATNADGTTSTTTERESCTSCSGSGRDRCLPCLGSGRQTCSTCRGRGKVECETCSPVGTVDTFIRRSFVASTVRTHILPVCLPGCTEPVSLSEGYVQIHPRDAATPFDAVADAAVLAERSVTSPAARIFFVRQASVTVHTASDERTGELLAGFVDGQPEEPLLMVRQTSMDPHWTPDRERSKAMWAFFLYGLAPLLLLAAGAVLLTQTGLGMLAAVLGGLGAAALIAGFLLYSNPLRAFRLAVLDVRCARHSRTATVRCGGCKQELCHECLLPSARCPLCGHVPSEAVTHLIEDGQLVAVSRAS